MNGDVVHGISTAPAQLEADGSLLTAGVTELKPRDRSPAPAAHRGALCEWGDPADRKCARGTDPSQWADLPMWRV